MYPRSFFCEEAIIKQRTSSKKELCEIGEEAIWKSRSTSLFFYRDIKFKKNDVPTKLPLRGSVNQATYSFKETTLRNRRESNMGIPIHILFLFISISSPHNFRQ